VGKKRFTDVDWPQLVIFLVTVVFFTGTAYAVLYFHDKRIEKLEEKTECIGIMNYKLDLLLGHFDIKVKETKNVKNCSE